MNQFVSLGYTSGKVVSTDEEIAKLENLIDQGNVEHMLALALEKVGPHIFKVHVMTQGTPLARAREMLRLGMESIDEIIGKPKGDHGG